MLARNPPSSKKVGQVVKEELTKYDAAWTDEKVARLSEYVQKAPVSKNNTHSDRIIAANRRAPLSWRKGVHYDLATTKARGRVRQGGAKAPYMVTLSALRAYHETL